MKQITKKDLERILIEAFKKGKKKKLPKPEPVSGFEDEEGMGPPPSYIDPDIDMNL